MIYLASDHAAYEMKKLAIQHLEAQGYAVTDLGPYNAQSVDYPDFAHKMAAALKTDHKGRGILMCGSGIGISIAANRHQHIRAALAHDVTTARLSRQHNDANVLCLGARIVGEVVVKDMIDAFMMTAFEQGRHQLRINKINFHN